MGEGRMGRGRAVRVAAAVTLLIAVVAVVAAAALDAFVARRVLWEVDQRLAVRLADVTPPLPSHALPDDQGIDGAPVFLWWISPAGRLRPLTEGGPHFPPGGRASVRSPVSVPTGAATFRFAASPFHDGWLVAGENLAGPSHIDRVLLVGELVLAPVLLATVFGGVLFIGWRASAPVEEARRRVLEFTADASHELRTPVTVIEAEIELATSGPPDPVGDREALRHVARESRRLKAIVEDMLWLARFDSAPPPPAGGPADLAAAAAAGTDRFRAIADGRGIDVAASLDGPVWVDAPPEWLDRLIGTLLDNACRYGTAQVRVSARSIGPRAVLTVEDDGPGIPVGQRASLFDRFRRATDEPGGAGLGLSIADSVVRSTAGRWRVDDSPLGGARMEVSWRRTTAPGPVTSPSRTPMPTGGAP